MFEDVPDRLVRFVRDHLLEESKTNRDLMYLEAAGGVIREYTGKAVFESGVDKFFNATVANEAGDLSAHYPLNVLRLADALFTLRRSPGFSEICRRFMGRDLRSTYFEVSVARRFADNGASLDFRAETGKKGEDFDFAAAVGSETVNVEVTALTAPSFSTNTIENALNTKRKQLPPTKPAAIFCIMPEAWAHQGVNLNAETYNIPQKFFKSTGRINVVEFMQEYHLDFVSDGSRGAFAVIGKPYRNPNPRYATTLFDFLFIESPDQIMRRQSMALARTLPPDSPVLNELTRAFQKSEFYVWVNSLHPT